MYSIKKAAMSAFKVKEEHIRYAAKQALNCDARDITLLSRGAYGFVYKFTAGDTGQAIAVKIFISGGFMQDEVAQLAQLRKYSRIKVPEVYASFNGDRRVKHEMFFMEAVRGTPIRGMQIPEGKEREKLVNEVVDNLIAIHQCTNPRGFGALNSETYHSSWESCYKQELDSYMAYIRKHKISLLSSKSRAFAEEAYAGFDRVFTQPVTTASLIHGDYKQGNILADPDTLEILALLDPLGCRYADREADLFQLHNSNEPQLGLLENYLKKENVSDNFALKDKYYQFFNDIRHYALMGYARNHAFEEVGAQLSDMLRHGG